MWLLAHRQNLWKTKSCRDSSKELARNRDIQQKYFLSSSLLLMWMRVIVVFQGQLSRCARSDSEIWWVALKRYEIFCLLRKQWDLQLLPLLVVMLLAGTALFFPLCIQAGIRQRANEEQITTCACYSAVMQVYDLLHRRQAELSSNVLRVDAQNWHSSTRKCPEPADDFIQLLLSKLQTSKKCPYNHSMLSRFTYGTKKRMLMVQMKRIAAHITTPSMDGLPLWVYKEFLEKHQHAKVNKGEEINAVKN